jgi:hypothetical protein
LICVFFIFIVLACWFKKWSDRPRNITHQEDFSSNV